MIESSYQHFAKLPLFLLIYFWKYKIQEMNTAYMDYQYRASDLSYLINILQSIGFIQRLVDSQSLTKKKKSYPLSAHN